MKIKFLEEAEEELIGQIDYYEDKVSGLGIDFYNEVKEAVFMIEASPQVWPVKRYKCRRFVLSRFPFTIHYYIKESVIWIVAVANTSREPHYWKDRAGDKA